MPNMSATGRSPRERRSDRRPRHGESNPELCRRMRRQSGHPGRRGRFRVGRWWKVGRGARGAVWRHAGALLRGSVRVANCTVEQWHAVGVGPLAGGGQQPSSSRPPLARAASF